MNCRSKRAWIIKSTDRCETSMSVGIAPRAQRSSRHLMLTVGRYCSVASACRAVALPCQLPPRGSVDARFSSRGKRPVVASEEPHNRTVWSRGQKQSWKRSCETLALTYILLMIASLMSALAATFPHLLVARAILGLGIGGGSRRPKLPLRGGRLAALAPFQKAFLLLRPGLIAGNRGALARQADLDAPSCIAMAAQTSPAIEHILMQRRYRSASEHKAFDFVGKRAVPRACYARSKEAAAGRRVPETPHDISRRCRRRRGDAVATCHASR